MVTLMVLRGGLLSLPRRALILRCLSGSLPGLRLAVALPVLCPEVATAEVEGSRRRRRSKGTKWKLQAMLPRLVRLCVSTYLVAVAPEPERGTEDGGSNSMWLSCCTPQPFEVSNCFTSLFLQLVRLAIARTKLGPG